MEASRSPESGRFARRGVRDARTLYAILRAVAEAAVADRPTADPRKVTTRQWRDARHLCEDEFGYIPLPQEIRRQLAKLNGELLPFPELLALVFDESRDTKRFHTAMQAEEHIAEAMSDHYVWYALRYVCRALDPEGIVRVDATLSPVTYERSRRQLIADDKRRWKYGGHLASRLPTYRQIADYAGDDWDKALEIAELAPRPKEPPRARAVPVAEAIIRFYKIVGVLPTRKKLERFATDYRFAMKGMPKGVIAPFLDEALVLIRERGLPEPPPYEETKRLKVTWPIPDAPEEIEAPRAVRGYTDPEIIETVIAFVATLGRGEAATQLRWSTFSSGQPGIPSGHVISQHGGLDALVARARRPDALARARAEHEAKIAEREEAKIVADAEKPQALAVLATMEALGGDYLRKQDIRAQLGWAAETVMAWLVILRRAGKVEVVEQQSSSFKLVRYRLVGAAAVSEQERERRLRDAETRMPQAQQVLAILAEHGPVPTKALGRELGKDTTTASHWLVVLQRAKLVETVRSPHDRRLRSYQLTELGWERVGTR